MLPIRRDFVRTPDGEVHVAQCGDEASPPVVLLHQTPRSWLEYRAVLPLLGRRHRAIAFDTPGFGDSAPLGPPPSIEGWARAISGAMHALGLQRADLVGHHTGGVIAVELAAAFPQTIRRLVLSSTPYTDAGFRRERAARPPIDEVAMRDDGSHLMGLWRARESFYPPGRPDLLNAFVLDALRVLDDVEAGHRAVGAYRMEERIGGVRAPTLIIRAPEDPFASPHAEQLAVRIPGARIVEVPGGMVPLPEQLPVEFATAIEEFLSEPRPGLPG